MKGPWQVWHLCGSVGAVWAWQVVCRVVWCVVNPGRCGVWQGRTNIRNVQACGVAGWYRRQEWVAQVGVVGRWGGSGGCQVGVGCGR